MTRSKDLILILICGSMLWYHPFAINWCVKAVGAMWGIQAIVKSCKHTLRYNLNSKETKYRMNYIMFDDQCRRICAEVEGVKFIGVQEGGRELQGQFNIGQDTAALYKSKFTSDNVITKRDEKRIMRYRATYKPICDKAGADYYGVGQDKFDMDYLWFKVFDEKYGIYVTENLEDDIRRQVSRVETRRASLKSGETIENGIKRTNHTGRNLKAYKSGVESVRSRI